MSNPLHAQHYADHAHQCRAAILENVCLAESTYRVRLHCPAIAARILPGQFVMLHLTGADDPLLGRPLALYDTVLDASAAFRAIVLTRREDREGAGEQRSHWSGGVIGS